MLEGKIFFSLIHCRRQFYMTDVFDAPDNVLKQGSVKSVSTSLFDVLYWQVNEKKFQYLWHRPIVEWRHVRPYQVLEPHEFLGPTQ